MAATAAQFPGETVGKLADDFSDSAVSREHQDKSKLLLS